MLTWRDLFKRHCPFTAHLVFKTFDSSPCINLLISVIYKNKENMKCKAKIDITETLRNFAKDDVTVTMPKQFKRLLYIYQVHRRRTALI